MLNIQKFVTLGHFLFEFKLNRNYLETWKLKSAQCVSFKVQKMKTILFVVNLED